MLLKTKIPTIYHTILEELLSIEIPNEKVATCDSCVLCQHKNSPYQDVKCCTYFPKLPNYLVGAILSDSSENQFAVQKTEGLIMDKKGITPNGLVSDKLFYENFKMKSNSKFDILSTHEAEKLKCPYLDGGKCSIWNYRDNVCITFFCSSSSGKKGYQFWDQLNILMTFVENTLSQHFMKNEGWRDNEIDRRNLNPKNFSIENELYQIDELEHQKLWKDWESKEEEFYLLTYERFKGMSKSDFLLIAGDEFSKLKKKLKSLAKKMQKAEYPEFLVLDSNVEIHLTKNGNYKLTLDKKRVELTQLHHLYLKSFTGEKSTTSIIQEAYKVFFNMNQMIDQLVAAKMLVIPS